MNTIYGISLDLDIPQLACNIDEHGVVVANGVDCNKPNIFGKYQYDPANLIVANKLILLVINAFVDFFIQYYNTGETTNLQAILDLKKIIFSFTEPSELASDLLYKFINVCRIDVGRVRDEITIPARVGVDGVNHVIGQLRMKQKQMNLFLLGLSYKVLSMSGILDISIDDMRDIIEKEKSRRNSFILQFLPVDNELPCFETVELCLLQHGNSEIYRKIMALVPQSPGGSRSRNNTKNKNKNKNKNSKHSTRRRPQRSRRSRRSQRSQRRLFFKIKTHKKVFS
jgi:hypothetical protein